MGRMLTDMLMRSQLQMTTDAEQRPTARKRPGQARGSSDARSQSRSEGSIVLAGAWPAPAAGVCASRASG